MHSLNNENLQNNIHIVNKNLKTGKSKMKIGNKTTLILKLKLDIEYQDILSCF